jgi:hypothetical protein
MENTADTAAASTLAGPSHCDEDALRKVKHLHDDVLDPRACGRARAEAPVEKKPIAAGVLSRLPEDTLRSVLGFLVLKQDVFAAVFIELMEKARSAGDNLCSTSRHMMRERFDLEERRDQALDWSGSLRDEAGTFIGRIKAVAPFPWSAKTFTA